jgi:hypothetical protein
MPEFRILRSFAALSPAQDDVGGRAQPDVAPALKPAINYTCTSTPVAGRPVAALMALV